MDSQLEGLAGGPDGRLVTLGDGRRFRVTVLDRGKRCPTLLLEETEEDAEAAPPGRWQTQFLAEAADLLAGAAEGGAHAPINFVLADLRALLRRDPRALTLLLFAGYLHVGDALSLRHGEPGDNRYARAACALHRLQGAALPEGALDRLLPAPDEAAAATRG